MDSDLYLTELPGELWRTLTAVLVDAIPAGPPVLTHVVGAVVHVGRAVLPDEPGEALAGVVGEVVLAGPPVLAGVPLARPGGAEGDLLLAVAALEAWDAVALVLPDPVDTSPVVLAPGTNQSESFWGICKDYKKLGYDIEVLM